MVTDLFRGPECVGCDMDDRNIHERHEKFAVPNYVDQKMNP